MDSITRLLNLNEHLEVWRIPSGEIAVSFSGCEIKDGDFLVSAFGTGKTFEEAADNYMDKISGKRLIFGAYTNHRREVVVL